MAFARWPSLRLFAFMVFRRVLLGGFVGVDVLFVISGYLITEIIGKPLAEHDGRSLT
jgi:peptidoglycan/LPS O-acetylase OafA/YrhL